MQQGTGAIRVSQKTHQFPVPNFHRFNPRTAHKVMVISQPAHHNQHDRLAETSEARRTEMGITVVENDFVLLRHGTIDAVFGHVSPPCLKEIKLAKRVHSRHPGAPFAGAGPSTMAIAELDALGCLTSTHPSNW